MSEAWYITAKETGLNKTKRIEEMMRWNNLQLTELRK